MWTQLVRERSYSLLPDKSVQMITADNKQEKWIELNYTLQAEGKCLYIRCENATFSQWSYTITGCTKNIWNKLFLNDVPRGKLKHWIITKTSTHLKIVCNSVTVLNFNFATDSSPGYKNGYQVWSKSCTALNIRTIFEDSIIVKTIGMTLQ